MAVPKMSEVLLTVDDYNLIVPTAKCQRCRKTVLLDVRCKICQKMWDRDCAYKMFYHNKNLCKKAMKKQLTNINHSFVFINKI
jgi:hypothetical protein